MLQRTASVLDGRNLNGTERVRGSIAKAHFIFLRHWQPADFVPVNSQVRLTWARTTTGTSRVVARASQRFTTSRNQTNNLGQPTKTSNPAARPQVELRHFFESAPIRTNRAGHLRVNIDPQLIQRRRGRNSGLHRARLIRSGRYSRCLFNTLATVARESCRRP